MKHGLLHLNGLVLAITFFVCRIMLLPRNIWRFVNDDAAPIAESGGYLWVCFFALILTVHMFLQLSFFYMICAGAVNTVVNMFNPKTQKTQKKHKKHE